MPIFDFKCQEPECGHIEEVLVRTEEDVPKCCPKCSFTKPPEKQVSAPSHALLGTGWYRDGYQ